LGNNILLQLKKKIKIMSNSVQKRKKKREKKRRQDSISKGGSGISKTAGDMVQFPPLFFLVVIGSNPLAVVVRKSDATKKGLYQLALWCGCGDGLIFSGSSYDSNQTFHSGWEPRWSRLREKITMIAHSRLFN
jgi:hypothetical protein